MGTVSTGTDVRSGETETEPFWEPRQKKSRYLGT
jgi:hypothetical protein